MRRLADSTTISVPPRTRRAPSRQSRIRQPVSERRSLFHIDSCWNQDPGHGLFWRLTLPSFLDSAFICCICHIGWYMRCVTRVRLTRRRLFSHLRLAIHQVDNWNGPPKWDLRVARSIRRFTIGTDLNWKRTSWKMSSSQSINSMDWFQPVAVRMDLSRHFFSLKARWGARWGRESTTPFPIHPPPSAATGSERHIINYGADLHSGARSRTERTHVSHGSTFAFFFSPFLSDFRG